MSTLEAQRVEVGSVEVLPDGEGFVLGLTADGQPSQRLQLPPWAVHQLMRLLPRLDAALCQARRQLGTELIAYPVQRWNVEPTGDGGGVAVTLQTDRQVELAYLLADADALALHGALGEALAPISAPAVRTAA